MILLLKSTELLSYNEMIQNKEAKKAYIEKNQIFSVDWLTNDLDKLFSVVYQELKKIDNECINKGLSVFDNPFKRYLQIKYRKYLIKGDYNISGLCYDDDVIDIITKWLSENTYLSTHNLGVKLSWKYNEILENELDYQNSEEGILEKTNENNYFDLEGNVYLKEDLIEKRHIALSNIYITKDEDNKYIR